MSKDFLWCEKYRPKTISETILPKALKDTFHKMVETGEIQNMIFSGTPGLGKTTVAKAMCNELGLDYILINGSEEGNIDTLRGKIKQFASTVSLQGGYKVVILDEADYLNPQSTQPALRGFIEEFSDNCRFILTCNFKNRIIEPLHSRCGVYEFNTAKKDMPEVASQFFKRLIQVLEGEGVEHTPQAVADMVSKYAPDWRRTLNEAQRRAVTGAISADVSSNNNSNVTALIQHLKGKDFKKMRQWVTNNMDVDTSAIFRKLYDTAFEYIEGKSIPQLVLILADYQYKDAFVADKELNTVACLTEIMAQVDFK